MGWFYDIPPTDHYEGALTNEQSGSAGWLRWRLRSDKQRLLSALGYGEINRPVSLYDKAIIIGSIAQTLVLGSLNQEPSPKHTLDHLVEHHSVQDTTEYVPRKLAEEIDYVRKTVE